MNKTDKKSLKKLFILYFFLVLIPVIAMPFVESSLFPQNIYPSAISLFLVGASVIVATAYAILFFIQPIINLPKKALNSLLIYNALLVFIKLSLSPFIIYEQNKHSPFTASLLFPNSGVTNPIFLTLTAIVVFFLYLIPLIGIKKYFMQRAKNLQGQNNALSVKKIVITIAIALFIVLGLIYFGTGHLLILLFFTGSSEYLLPLLFSPQNIFIFLSLLTTAYFLAYAYNSVAQQARITKDTSIFALFTIVAIAFLIAFQALWIVYFLILTSLWPLRTVTSK